MPITVAPSARGRFTLVAANGLGSSDAFPSGGNTLWVISSLDDKDTDGDGFPDALEVALGSDPFDPASVPNPKASGETETEARPVSVINAAAPGQPTTQEADAVPFSALNLAGVTGGNPVRMEAAGIVVSVFNIDPAAPMAAQTGSGSGGGGQGGSGGQPAALEADAVVFGVNNLAANAPPAAIQAAVRPNGNSPPGGSIAQPGAILESRPLEGIGVIVRVAQRNNYFGLRDSKTARRKP